jgi:hypothetical protein
MSGITPGDCNSMDGLVWRRSSRCSDGSCVEVGWRKSTYSTVNGCVEVRGQDGHVHVRDSKDREGPVLTFTRQEWLAFLAGVRNDEFDLEGTG